MPDIASLLPPTAGYNFPGGPIHHGVPASLIPSNQDLPSPFVVVVTGASRGIGAATAIAFAQAGASGIVITARKATSLDDTKKSCEKAAKRQDVKVTAVEADSSANEAPAIAIAEAVQKEHGRLDCLILNAGWLATEESAFEKEFHKTNAHQISGTMDTNYTGRFIAVKHLMPILLATPNGAKRIINVTSLGSHMTAGGAFGYSASVFASNRLIEATAERYADHGVLAHSVHPGAVLSTPPPGVPEWLLKESKDDAALFGSVAIWLCRQRREWLNGRYISANWDLETLETKRQEIVDGDKLKFRMVI